MAKQCGPVLLSGPLGDFSFYEMKGEFYIRFKTCHKVDTDPRFTKTYLTGLDFGTASRASKLLRTALGPAITPCSDDRLASRLSGRFVSVVHADTIHRIGQRRVLTAHLALLQGFQFNKHQAFDTSGITTKIFTDSTTGQLKVSLSIPPNMANAPLVACIACVNFEKGTYTKHTHATVASHETKQGEWVLPAPPQAGLHDTIVVALGQPGAMAIVAAHQPVVPLKAEHKLKRSSQISRHHSVSYTDRPVVTIIQRGRLISVARDGP